MPDIYEAIEGLKRGETWQRKTMLGAIKADTEGVIMDADHEAAEFLLEDFTATDWQQVEPVQERRMKDEFISKMS